MTSIYYSMNSPVQLNLCLWLQKHYHRNGYWLTMRHDTFYIRNRHLSQTFIPNLSILRSCRWVHHQIPTIYGRNLGRRIGQNVRAYFQCGSSLETFCLFHPQFDIIGRFHGGPNFDPVKYVKEVCHVKHMHATSVLISVRPEVD